jgi:voltage-gated potassium channel
VADKTPWLRLQRPERIGPGASLALRGLLVLALIGVALAGHWFDRAGLHDNADKQISFLDVVYFTAITVATVGYGDIVPVSDSARMFDTFVVTPIRLFVWLIFLGTAYDFIFKRLWDRWLMQKIQRELHGHCIVCGYGTSGEATVGELIRGGADPLQIVVIDPSAERIEKAVACGVTGLTGDATHNEVLSAARIETADSVLVCTGRDDSAALVVLSARTLAPNAHVSAIVKSAENEGLLRQAGASVVVNPVDLGGHLLARATGSAHVVDYVTDLVTNTGRVCLRERPVTSTEIGQPLSALTTGLGVRIDRGGTLIGFWEAAARALQAGDVIVEIVPTDSIRVSA